MQFIKNTRIIKRLIIGFAVILLVFVGTSGFGVYEVSVIKNSLNQINDENSVLQRYAINFRGSVHDRAIALRDVVLVNKASELQQAIDDIEKLDSFYQEAAIEMDKAFADPDAVDPKALAILKEIKATEDKTQPFIHETVKLVTSGQKEAGYNMLMNDARPLFTHWLGVINQFIDLMEEKNKKETAIARSVADNYAYIIMGVSVLSVLIGLLVAFWIIPSIQRLNALTKEMLELADGNLDFELTEVNEKTEIGDVAAALTVFKENGLESRKASLEKEDKQKLELERAEKLTQINKDFEEDSQQIVSNLMASVQKIQEGTEKILEAANQSLGQTDNASNHANSTSSNVQTVAAASQELSSSIREISKNLSMTADNTKACSDSARVTQENLEELQNAVSDIDTVIQAINDVAEQTNLLALNATIEAARAGDAGKGFAVVASEVKSLANETHKMTEEISKKVEDIKNSAQETISSVTDIIHKIEDVDGQTTGVASAVEEQNASTTEIARNIESAAQGTSEVSNSISIVKQAANDSVEITNGFKEIANELNQSSTALGESIQKFIKNVREI